MIAMSVLFVLAMLALYFVPWIMAAQRHHRNAAPIGIVNLFFGWTFIGWVVRRSYGRTRTTVFRKPRWFRQCRSRTFRRRFGTVINAMQWSNSEVRRAPIAVSASPLGRSIVSNRQAKQCE